MQTISVRELCAAVDGKLICGSENAKISAVNTDSRTVKSGELFLPLKGEKFDGHSYIDNALAAGAEGCLCSIVPEHKIDGKFYVTVEDTLLALKKLAAWYRSRFQIPFVQITGSVGKTTTKEMVASVLSEHFNTLKTKANFNNEIGTPQTLLGLSPAHEAAVIETGMDGFGQIRYLGEMVKPTVAVITNIGDAHIEFLGSREGILKAKSEIFENLASDGFVVLNGDDALLDTIKVPQKTVRCGKSEKCDIRVTAIQNLGIDGISCTVTTGKGSYALSVPAPGEHMIYPAAMAVAIGEYYGLTKEEILRGVAAYEPSGSRMHIINLPDNRTLLDDCYNANPQSMAASLRVLANAGGRKIAVLGDMAELGSLTEQAHRDMGKLTKELGIDTVIAVGERARWLAEENEAAQWFATAPEAVAAAKAALTQNSTMLIKASHSMHLEKITEELQKA